MQSVFLPFKEEKNKFVSFSQNSKTHLATLFNFEWTKSCLMWNKLPYFFKNQYKVLYYEQNCMNTILIKYTYCQKSSWAVIQEEVSLKVVWFDILLSNWVWLFNKPLFFTQWRLFQSLSHTVHGKGLINELPM